MRHAALRMRGLLVCEDIAQTSHGSDYGLLSGAINFAAQSVNMYVNNIRVWLNAHAPDLVENHGTCDHAPCIPAQILQQGELLLRQL